MKTVILKSSFNHVMYAKILKRKAPKSISLKQAPIPSEPFNQVFMDIFLILQRVIWNFFLMIDCCSIYVSGIWYQACVYLIDTLTPITLVILSNISWISLAHCRISFQKTSNTYWIDNHFLRLHRNGTILSPLTLI